MRLNANGHPLYIFHEASFLTAVHMVFSIQTHITEQHNLNMFQAQHVKKVGTSEVFRNV